MTLLDSLMYPIFALIGLCCVTIFVESIGKAKSKIYAIAQMLPVISIIVCEGMWMETEFFKNYAAYVMILFGFTFSCVQIKLIICSTVHQRFEILHWPVMVLIGLTAYFKAYESTNTAQQMFYTFWGVFAAILAMQMWFLVDVIDQMTKSLGIYCLSLDKRKKE